MAGIGRRNYAESRAGGNGAPRKSRRKRLWISGTLGAPPEWTPSEDDWRQFEASYEMSFNDELRGEIKKAVQKYFYWATYEPTAPFADEFVQKIAKARKLAAEISKVFASFGEAGALVAPHWGRYFPAGEKESIPDRCDENGDALIDHILAMPERRGRDHRDIEEVLHTVYSALDDTMREVNSSDAPAFAEGDCWKQLIADLINAFEKKEFEVSAAKGQYHRISPFVAFVKELQSTFAEELRRHTSRDALSKEISKVLHQIRIETTKKHLKNQ